jgi:hypothetical protein
VIGERRVKAVPCKGGGLNLVEACDAGHRNGASDFGRFLEGLMRFGLFLHQFAE